MNVAQKCAEDRIASGGFRRMNFRILFGAGEPIVPTALTQFHLIFDS